MKPNKIIELIIKILHFIKEILDNWKSDKE